MSPSPDTPKTAVVLVHGAWHGAWCWRRVLPLLRGAGVEAHAVTLTGVGERAHLLSLAVDLHTHIQDVFGLVEAEELQRIVLVGHSYAGVVVTGVADRLQRERPAAWRTWSTWTRPCRIPATAGAATIRPKPNRPAPMPRNPAAA